MFLYQTSSCRRAFPQVRRAGMLLCPRSALGACSSTTKPPGPVPPRRRRPQVRPRPARPTAAAAEPETVTSNLPDVPDAEPGHDGRYRDIRAAQRERAQELRRAARRHAVGPRQYVPAGSLAVAGDLVREPGGQQSAPHLSGRHAAPGDCGSNGKPQCRWCARQRQRHDGSSRCCAARALEAPIANIPYSIIAAFLSRPGVLTTEQVKAAPYVLALA